MGFMLIVLVAYLFYRLLIYSNLEITPHKYWLIRAMVRESQGVDDALKELLKEKQNYKILNKEFSVLENTFIKECNQLILMSWGTNNTTLRKEILNRESFK